MNWSNIFLTPYQLTVSRMLCLNPEYLGLVKDWLGLTAGQKILDAGCGTGSLSFYLGRTMQGLSFTGLDLDEEYLRFAKKEAAALKDGNQYTFVNGNAAALPFPDGCFDAVVSLTFLTVAADTEKILAEMKRVTKPGGRIVSLAPAVFASGAFCSDPDWTDRLPEKERLLFDELRRLSAKLYQLKSELVPPPSFVQGLPPDKLPAFFQANGLKEVGLHALGNVFSLSNAAMPEEDKRRFIELSELTLLTEAERLQSLPEIREHFSAAEFDLYTEAVKAKCAWQLAHLNDNFSWECQPSLLLVLIGKV